MRNEEPLTSLWTRYDLETVLGFEVLGTWKEECLAGNFCIDSRKAKEGDFFIALSGEHTDGHHYVDQAFRLGCAGALMGASHKAEGQRLVKSHPDKMVLLAPDTLQALGHWAAFHRSRLKDLCVVGVTGSNGKTTTKEILAALLKTLGPTYATPGNLNSEIGLPLSVLQIRPNHRFAVLEMGMNHEGEMSWLASVAKPNLAIVTNVGTAHIGILGTRQVIAEEKKGVFSYFTEKNTAVIPADSDFADFLASGLPGKVLTFAASDAEPVEDLALRGSRFYWKGQEFFLSLGGAHNRLNALAALTAAYELGAKLEDLVPALAGVRPSFGRSEIVEGAFCLIKDYYNANLDSMETLLGWIRELKWKGRKIGVLGSMKELGSQTESLHRTLARTALSLDWEDLFFFGEETQVCLWEAQKSFPHAKVFWTDSMEVLIKKVLSAVGDGDLVVLKGSRGVALERLGEKLEEKCQKGGPAVHVL